MDNIYLSDYMKDSEILKFIMSCNKYTECTKFGNIKIEISEDKNNLTLNIDMNKLLYNIGMWCNNFNCHIDDSFKVPMFKGKFNEIKNAICDKNTVLCNIIASNPEIFYKMILMKNRDLYEKLWEPTKKHIEYHELKKNTMRTTDQFNCYKCHKNKIIIYERQTCSADESATIFFECINCGYHWKK